MNFFDITSRMLIDSESKAQKFKNLPYDDLNQLELKNRTICSDRVSVPLIRTRNPLYARRNEFFFLEGWEKADAKDRYS
jgi:hypothetical protein